MKNFKKNEAHALMMGFLQRTGVSATTPMSLLLPTSKRYLWTDAFAVCNLLALNEQSLALSLIYYVHHILGKHRVDDKQTGWLSGLNEQEGEQHPTVAGLRIGKNLPERSKNEPVDERLEWDRDGQYYHYLTKWMHALDQTSRWTKQKQFNKWAIELAVAAHTAFTYRLPSDHLRMYWKMSIDLTYPLIYSQGQHDPLDGYITYHQLHKTAAAFNEECDKRNNDLLILKTQCDQLETLINQRNWETTDPLGIGCILMDAFRVYQLMRQNVSRPFNENGWQLLEALLATAIRGLKDYVKWGELKQPAAYRLAFRELGLCIGLHAVRLMEEIERNNPCCSHLPHVIEGIQTLQMNYASVRDTIEKFWCDIKQREGNLWKEHQDINEVMLATCLVPNGFLILRS